MYQVGQILYLLSKKSIDIKLAQVIEEINRKTLTETLNDYVVNLYFSEEVQLNLSKVKVDYIVFDSITSLEEYMISESKKSISLMLLKLKEKENRIFNKSKETKEFHIEEKNIVIDQPQETITVCLPDGTIVPAKVNFKP